MDKELWNVSGVTAQQFADEHKCLFFECSALTGINIKEVFTGLAEQFLAKGVVAGAAEDQVNLQEEPISGKKKCC